MLYYDKMSFLLKKTDRTGSVGSGCFFFFQTTTAIRFILAALLVCCVSVATFSVVPAQAQNMGKQQHIAKVPQNILQKRILQSTPQGVPRAETIKWHLENPFRLFTRPEDTEMHRLEWIRLSAEEKKSPVLSTERKLARKLPFGWASSVYRHTCWDNLTHRYKHCRDNTKQYITPTHHRIIASHVTKALLPDTCTWEVIPARKLSRKLRTKLQLSATANCTSPVRLDIPYPAGGEVIIRSNGRFLGSRDVRVRDVFIVGIGDSFASGEGNPDNPVSLSPTRSASYGIDANKKVLAGYPTRLGNWRKIGDKRFQQGAAGWLSKACHRSLYSYQLRTALQLALENRKRAITYIGYACAGSEIPLGLFKRYKGTDWDKQYPFFPQISSVANEQCGEGHAAVEKDYSSAYSQLGKVPDLEMLVLLKCKSRSRRKIDLLLVSIGGNDVGFSRLVANAVIKDRSKLKRLGGWMAGNFTVRHAKYKLRELKHRLKALNKATHYILGIPWKQSDRIILTAYPPMSYEEDGVTLCDNTRRYMDVYDQFQLNTTTLARDTRFAEQLNRQMRAHTRRLHWTFVEEHRDIFRPHGFCAQNPDSPNPLAEELRFPFFKNGKWIPYSPASYEPYTPRQRWFRTPNDAYLTTHLHASGSIIRKILQAKRLAWFQVLLAATYSGSFHPTAEGHAAMADATLKKARQILAKYR